MVKKILKITIPILLATIILMSLERLLVPKYMSEQEEGALIAEYYLEENKDFDVLFVGDCEVYENFVPLTLWEEYGIHSYIRGSAQQLIWQSYYLAEDSFTYDKPDVLVFNVLSMKYNEPQKEAYNRMTLEGMRWSPSKVKAICASMTEEESFIEYVFPILRYHTRWNQLKEEDLQYFLKRDIVAQNGYEMQIGTVPVEYIPKANVLGDYSFGDNAWSYLNQMADLCAENDVELVLIKAPSLYPHWYEEWDAQICAFAKERGLNYYNFLDETETIGLDFATDTYDAGLHLNLDGAIKMSSYFGEILVRDYEIADRRGDEELSQIWSEKKERFEQKKEQLQSEEEKDE